MEKEGKSKRNLFVGVCLMLAGICFFIVYMLEDTLNLMGILFSSIAIILGLYMIIFRERAFSKKK